MLAEPGCPARRSSCEITESTVMADPRRAPPCSPRLRDARRALRHRRLRDGLLVTVVSQAPPRRRGEDRQVVRRDMAARSDAAIVRSTIDLARNLGLRSSPRASRRSRSAATSPSCTATSPRASSSAAPCRWPRSAAGWPPTPPACRRRAATPEAAASPPGSARPGPPRPRSPPAPGRHAPLAQRAVDGHERARPLDLRRAPDAARGRAQLVEQGEQALAGRHPLGGHDVGERALDAVARRRPAVLLDAPGVGRGGRVVARGGGEVRDEGVDAPAIAAASATVAWASGTRTSTVPCST